MRSVPHPTTSSHYFYLAFTFFFPWGFFWGIYNISDCLSWVYSISPSTPSCILVTMNPLVNLLKNRHVHFTVSTVLYTKETFNMKIAEISYRIVGNSNSNYKKYFWKCKELRVNFIFKERNVLGLEQILIMKIISVF